jgi:hypothetical protein
MAGFATPGGNRGMNVRPNRHSILDLLEADQLVAD